MRKSYFLTLITFCFVTLAQAQELTVEKIMQDPKWMGTFPSNVRWDVTGKSLYFNYNQEEDRADSLYKVVLSDPSKIVKVSPKEANDIIPSNAVISADKTQKVYTQRGNLMEVDLMTGERKTLIAVGSGIANPVYLKNNTKIAFSYEGNIFTYDKAQGVLTKVTNVKSGSKPKKSPADLEQRESWLKEQNLELLQVVREREEKKEQAKAYSEATSPQEKAIFTNDKQATNLQLSPDEKFVVVRLFKTVDNKKTIVPDYVDASGYTVDLPTRSKVGDLPASYETLIYDIEKDTSYQVSITDLPGLADQPDFIADYPDKEWEEKEREVTVSSPVFSSDGAYAVVNIRSNDNKDRWIAQLDLTTGILKSLNRQRDEAWIAGPGIGYNFGGGTFGWLPDNKHIYFQSEESGYSHLYLLDVSTGTKKQLTKGEFEVFDPYLSRDGKHWYLTTSEVDAGERHLYKIPIMGGKMEKLTSMEGNNDVTVSPDEKHIAILHSYSNKPWELYLKENKVNAQAKQVTSGQSEEFKSYSWREPELIKFKAQDGAMVPARLYVPAEDKKNGAAVVFVHGAGYLQNVHKWWSSYFREYMFHNLLTDLGYTVLDVDYRGSAGYGRDWRTGIYRHMGGKDLSDHVDGVKHLIENYGVDANRVGIYGGSYGGFITLMALFNEAETFKSGAALRSVTDWAHYNHGYTSNILNEPFNDQIAYQKSSPIYFAEGLEGNLLIAHGMVDVNVHFQDVVRLAQRLIELKKENWEMAVYPVEDHGFVEPSSWTDEYRRILKLFNDTLLE